MAWKIERWFQDLNPGEARIYKEFSQLPARELAVVVGATLDCALADLLSQRLVNDPKEYEEFLGLDENGRAPAGSFGSRIQLSLLIGLISNEVAQALRIIKFIRNRFSHRIKVSFSDPEIQNKIAALLETISKFEPISSMSTLYRPDVIKVVRKDLSNPKIGSGLLIAISSKLHGHLNEIGSEISRLAYVGLTNHRTGRSPRGSRR